MKGKIKLLHSLRLFFISLLICLVASIITFQIINRYQAFNARADKMRADYVEQQKQMIKREVERIVETIQHKKSLSEKKAAAKAKQRVYEAYDIAKHLYQQYKNTKSTPEIQTMIRETLRSIRFDHGLGYYFINQFSGIFILIADRPELEGQPLLDYQDTQGRYIIQDMIKIVQQSSEGFYRYTWTKPNTNKQQEFAKITFIKHFEPYDWFIGTGVYVSDIEAQIQTELLEEIGKIRYGKNGYLFVDDWEGVVLVHGTQPQLIGKNIWNFEDSKGVKVVQNLIAASKTKTGDFVYYSWKKPDTGEERAKISFSMGIPDWQWMIGTGVYIDDIEKEIAQLQIELDQQLTREIRNTLFITSAILIIFILFLNLFYRSLRDDFSLFVSFFNQAANLDQEIDRKALWFNELVEMANYANQMLRDKRKAQRKLQQHRDHLEVEVAERTQWLKEKTLQLEQANEEITQLNEQLKSENLRMSAELDVAKQLQQMVLPKKAELEQIEGLDIACFMEPADEVAGDYYDVLQENGWVKIGIGDVTGHGLESGVLMLMVQMGVQTLLTNEVTDPEKFLNVLNRAIYKNVQRIQTDKNLTLSLLDYHDGTLQLTGQHEEILLVRQSGQVERIDTFDLGYSVGVVVDIANWVAQTKISLQPGDGIVLYTDGITEAQNTQEELYGLDRLCEVVSQNWRQTAKKVQQAVIEDVRQFIGKQKVFDDITLLVLKQK
jgi:serine phosphatase RsbU (regulator of sigma subunit)